MREAGTHGGSFGSYDDPLLASHRYYYCSPTAEVDYIGFRVAEVSEPGSIGLLALGGLAVMRRRR